MKLNALSLLVFLLPAIPSALAAVYECRDKDGPVFSVSLDGTPLPTLRSSMQFDITQDEWQGAARDATLHILTAAVVDQSGNRLIAAPPVQFYAQRSTVRR